MMRWLLPALLLLLIHPAFATPGSQCPVPEALQLHQLQLPETARALAENKPVRIVAFGSSSTLGRAAGDPSLTYPGRLQARLSALLPKAMIEVINAGASREDSGQMLQRLDQAVLARRPSLVIWEAGTNDATRGRETDTFATNIMDGITRLRAAHIDVILMDMQYAPGTAALIDFEPYVDVLHQVADISDVGLLRRYEIMRDWNDQQVFDYDADTPQEQTKTARMVYDCLAAELASGIAEAVK